MEISLLGVYSMVGIDVSKHNGKIDWQKVDLSGIDFALIRAGFGNDISQKILNLKKIYKERCLII